MRMPDAQQLRAMDVRELRDMFSISLQEAKRLKLERRIRDDIEHLADEDTRFVLRHMLALITGREEN